MPATATSTWDHIRLSHDEELARIDAGGSSAIVFGIENTTTVYPGATYVERMRITSTGNVGIGTNAPECKLDIRDNYLKIGYLTSGPFDNVSRLQVYGSDGNGIVASFKHPNNSQGIAIRWDGISAMGSVDSTNVNQDIVISPRGAGMTICNVSSYSATFAGGYLGSGGSGIIGSNTWPGICAKFLGFVWATQTIVVSSDIRIKEDIQDILDDTALQSILAIEPKTYKYVDKLVRGNKKVFGFIAQQIKDVIPEAVIIEKSYIPNIYLVADYIDCVITLSSQPTKVVIKVNDKIKCYDKDNNEILVEVIEVIDGLTFRIKEIEYTDTKIFVYGTFVDDFHTLNKDYIFTLNVCATQELHRRIEAQSVLLKSQDDRIKDLETKVAMLMGNTT